MGLKDVKQDILEHVQAKAAALERSAERDAKQILAAAETELRELEKTRTAEATVLHDETMKKRRAQARLEQRKRQLTAKQAVLTEVFQQAEARILAMPAKEQEKLLSTLVKSGMTDIQAKYARARSEDVTRVQKYTRGVTVSADTTILGGVALENGDKTIGVDYTFGTLLDQVKKQSLGDLSKELFK